MNEINLSERDIFCAVKAGPQPLKQLQLDCGIPSDTPPLGLERTLFVHAMMHATMLASRGELPNGVTEMLCENFGRIITVSRLIPAITESLALDTALEDHPVAEDLQAMVRASKWGQVLKRTATMSRDDFCALLGFVSRCARDGGALKVDRRRNPALLSEIYRHQVVPEHILLALMAAHVDSRAEMLFRMWL